MKYLCWSRDMDLRLWSNKLTSQQVFLKLWHDDYLMFMTAMFHVWFLVLDDTMLPLRYLYVPLSSSLTKTCLWFLSILICRLEWGFIHTNNLLLTPWFRCVLTPFADTESFDQKVSPSNPKGEGTCLGYRCFF